MMKFTTSTQANDWAIELVSAAGAASKKSLGEVSNSYVIGVLSTTIKGLLLNMKQSDAKAFVERELNWLGVTLADCSK